MPSQVTAVEPTKASGDDVAKDLKEKLHVSQGDAREGRPLHHGNKQHLRPSNNARKLSVDDADWRSPSVSLFGLCPCARAGCLGHMFRL